MGMRGCIGGDPNLASIRFDGFGFTIIHNI